MREQGPKTISTRAGTFVVLALALLLGYQNCGSDFVLKDDLLGQTTEQSISCELSAFKSTYAPFLTKCQGCHVPGGVGKDAFAASNSDLAYSEFLLATPTLINQRAVLASHAPGVTGPANQSALDTASNGYTAAIAACSAGTSGPTGPTLADPTFPAVTADKALNAPPTTQTLSIALDTDLVSGSRLVGGTMTVIVQSTLQADGNYLYTISQPKITTKAQGVHVAAIMLRFNGADLPLVTTFSRIDQTIAANQTNVSLSTAAAAYVAPPPGTTPNKLGISFGTFQPQ